MLTIGKLAHSVGVSSDTLRYYEQEGLIEPAGKSPAGYRLYDQDSARRFRFIKQAQQCGFTLAEIRELLVLRGRDAARCGDGPSRDARSSPPSSNPRQPRGRTDHWTRTPNSSGWARRARRCRCCVAQRRCLPSCSARSA